MPSARNKPKGERKRTQKLGLDQPCREGMGLRWRGCFAPRARKPFRVSRPAVKERGAGARAGESPAAVPDAEVLRWGHRLQPG